MVVRLDGVNINTESGAREALARIRMASARFCNTDEGVAPIWRRIEVQDCYRAMSSAAVSKLAHPLVTALYRGRPISEDRQMAAR